jgi:hypothetical protein
MCFNNSNPKAPEVTPVTPPPPTKPLLIAQTSKLQPTRDTKKVEKQQVKYGAKSARDPRNINKRDAASLLVPLNDTGSKPGGINI